MILFVTHPEVVIDPAVPVPEWPLSEVGRGRMEAFAKILAGGPTPVVAVWSSGEQKARDGAEIVAGRLGLTARVEPDLHENDRAATGYVAPPEFWEIVEQFFARPYESVRGWETAAHAQARIVAAVGRVAAAQTAPGLVVIVSHGGVGRLLMAHLQGVAIGQEDRPAHPGGGCWIAIRREGLTVQGGWRNVEDYGR
ncbi:histidine phosphatase family protein [Phenylobacterium sp.]|uniref:histidine phosphatase family protein n=1 Tax=Phenylobacterium sp. TaxID=1871053 RepID=UPI0027373794|nr:histidine phosphatase family protein [Phenylobacterium sp.]MDP3853252.1 histidine phosphatase family protein [Phenylobacterium sp.]